MPGSTTPGSPVHGSAADGLSAAERLPALLAVLIAVCMATLDTAIVNTALPTVARDIGASDAAAVWVVTAYQIAMVATILPLASLSEIIGHRRVFIGGLILFTLTSLACGFAWSLPTLVAARALQGLGASAVMSQNTTLIRFIYPARMLGRGLGMNALVVGLAFTIGPTVASLILSVTTWHWLFLVNGPFGLAALALSLRTLPQTERAARRFDAVSATLNAGLFGLLIFALGNLSHGDTGLLVFAELAAAVVCGYALVRREAAHPAPLLALDLFRRPSFALSSATSICAFSTQGLAFVALPFLLQDTLGYSQVDVGFLITPWPALVAVTAIISGRMSDHYPPAILGGCGLAVLACGMAALALLPAHPDTVGIAWRMTLCGIGFGFFQSPNLRAIMGAAPSNRSGGAGGVIAISRLLGQSTGAALVALWLTLAHERGPTLALWTGAVFAAAGCVVSFLRLVAR